MSAVPLEVAMAELSLLGLRKKLIAAQLEIGEIRKSWTNPALLENEVFQKLIEVQEIMNSGCNEKQKAFFNKLEKLCIRPGPTMTRARTCISGNCCLQKRF